MKQSYKIIIRLLSIICINAFIAYSDAGTDGKRFYDSYQEFYYKNGSVKEKADWNSGLIIGSRRLYDKSRTLREEHIFKPDKIIYENSIPVKGEGIIKTYYKSGDVASVVPVTQEINAFREKKEYILRIFGTVKGYHYEDNNMIVYEYTLDIPFVLNSRRIDYYSKYNTFYNDVFLLYKSRNLYGLNTQITYYHINGQIASAGEIRNGKKGGYWEYFYPDGQLKAKGNFYTHNTISDYKVGKWEYLHENGNIMEKLEYSNINSVKINIGDLINTGKYYDEKGNLHYIIQYPRPGDINIYSDTIEYYYPAGPLNYRYEKNIKAPRYNNILQANEPYFYSGKYTEYYEDGKMRTIGYLSKKVRKTESEDDIKLIPCLTEQNKKIGFWYYFNNEENIVRVCEHYICGNIKKEFSPSEISKINRKYRIKKDVNQLDFVIR